MIRNSICTIIISVITIFIMHFLYEYFKKNLTTPKIKDLILKPKKEYENIYKIIQDDTMPYLAHEPSDTNITENIHIGKTPIDNIPISNIPISNIPNSNNINKELIKDELKNFFNDLNTDHTTNTNNTNNTNNNNNTNNTNNNSKTETNIVYENYNQDANFTNF